VILSAIYLEICNMIVDLHNVTDWYSLWFIGFMIHRLQRYTQVGKKEIVYTCTFSSLKECIHSDTCLLRLQ